MRKRNNALKKITAFALAAGLSVGMLAGSVQQADAATNYRVGKYTYSKNYKLDDGTTYFTVKGKFPQITDTSDAATKINQALTKEKNRLINQWKKDSAEYKKEMEAYEELQEMQYGDEISYKVYSNDEKYFSVMLSGYLFTGGAHGTPYQTCLTFDAQTGEKLTAAKVFGISKKKLNEKVRKLYLKKYDKQGQEAGFYTDMNGDKQAERKTLQDNLKNLDFNNNFYVKNGKAVFYAEPYAVGPYASGFITVTAAIQ